MGSGKKTSEVARELGIKITKLYSLIRLGNIQRPPTDASGDMWWSSDDVERVRQVLAAGRRRVKEPAA